MAPNEDFLDALAADAAVFMEDFGTTVTNGSSSATGLLSERDISQVELGVEVQRRGTVLRMKTGDGGTIVVGTVLTINALPYRVDRIIPVEPELTFTDYVLVGGFE